MNSMEFQKHIQEKYSPKPEHIPKPQPEFKNVMLIIKDIERILQQTDMDYLNSVSKKGLLELREVLMERLQ